MITPLPSLTLGSPEKAFEAGVPRGRSAVCTVPGLDVRVSSIPHYPQSSGRPGAHPGAPLQAAIWRPPLTSSRRTGDGSEAWGGGCWFHHHGTSLGTDRPGHHDLRTLSGGSDRTPPFPGKEAKVPRLLGGGVSLKHRLYCMHAHTHTQGDTHTHKYTYARAHTSTHMDTHACTRTHRHTCAGARSITLFWNTPSLLCFL